MYVGKKKIDSPKLQYCVSCVCLEQNLPPRPEDGHLLSIGATASIENIL